MPANLAFYFDFSSPYGYFAAQDIDALAARFGRGVDWHPVLLGAVFKTTGMAPLMQIPIKGEYCRHDWQRLARLTGTAYAEPTVLPVATQAAARAFLHAKRSDAARARELALALYRAYFAEGRRIDDPGVVLDICAEQGRDRAEFEAAINSPALKDELRAEVAAAEARGVFGSPFVFVDGEPFWGYDRFPMVEQWLARGGF